MKSLKAYFKGWSSLFRYKWMWMLLYLSNFIFAFLAAIPVSGFLGNTVGHSLSLERSVEAFDYIFLNELMNEYRDLIISILDQSVLFVLLFLLFSVFLMGGVLNILKKDQERFSFNVFLKGCAKYFWRLFRLNIYFIAIQVGVLAIFFFLFYTLCNGLSPFEMESEKQMIDALLVLTPIYMLVFTIISMIQDYSKIHLVHQDPGLLFKTFQESLGIVFKSFWRFFFLYLLNIITLLVSFGIYWFLKGLFDASTMLSVFLMFVIIQFFVIARVGVKILNLSSATYLYKWTRIN
jgi:hypothetical protein